MQFGSRSESDTAEAALRERKMKKKKRSGGIVVVMEGDMWRRGGKCRILDSFGLLILLKICAFLNIFLLGVDYSSFRVNLAMEIVGGGAGGRKQEEN